MAKKVSNSKRTTTAITKAPVATTTKTKKEKAVVVTAVATSGNERRTRAGKAKEELNDAMKKADDDHDEVIDMEEEDGENDDDNDGDDDDAEDDDDEDMGDKVNDDDDDDIEDKSDDDDDEIEEDGAAALFKTTVDDDDDEEDDDDDDEDDEQGDDRLPFGSSSEQYTFDLRNILAINNDQLPSNALYTTSSKMNTDDEKTISIPLVDGGGLTIDEEFLLSKATAGCSELMKALWQLPSEQSDAGPLVTLPTYDELRLPRSLPPPPPKQETKWEKFAKAKGLPLNKEKRARKVWDENTQTWLYRHGYERANKDDKGWPIMEVGANDDPYENPWEKLREEKRSRIEKNRESRLKNEERAGNIAKGQTNRVVKAREQAYKAGKEAGKKDVLAVQKSVPIGVPVDLKGEGSSKSDGPKLRGKASTIAALSAVQRSTASLGKFDKMREGEPERKKSMIKTKKRKYESATDRTVLSSEGDKSLKILKSVMNGGGAAKEKAIRKGQLAKGETAYDHDYDDGLGPSSFKKKKGRAGAGKMKKMTKKRAK